jgi:hypothetical protein
MTSVSIVATDNSDHICTTMAQDIIVAFDTIVAFVIPLVTMLTSAPVMWHEEHIWNVSVLLSNLVGQETGRQDNRLREKV